MQSPFSRRCSCSAFGRLVAPVLTRAATRAVEAGGRATRALQLSRQCLDSGILRSAERPERPAQLLAEELRLLPRCEVAALLDPAARGLPDLAREGREAEWKRHRRRSLTARPRGGLSALPVRPRRRGP